VKLSPGWDRHSPSLGEVPVNTDSEVGRVHRRDWLRSDLAVGLDETRLPARLNLGSPPRPATQPHNGWRADSVLAASAEAGREFDKLATDLTTPRDSLTREVNLVVSLSRTPPLITSPSRSHLLPSYDRFSLSVYRFRERGSAAFNQPLLTKPSITRSLGHPHRWRADCRR